MCFQRLTTPAASRYVETQQQDKLHYWRDKGHSKAIALRLAREGANVVVTGKSVQPNPKAPITIYSTAHEVEDAGGRALAIQLDVRDENAVAAAVRAGAEKFDGIDILVNNASAITLTGTLTKPAKRYDLMNQINARGTFICSQTCDLFLD